MAIHAAKHILQLGVMHQLVTTEWHAKQEPIAQHLFVHHCCHTRKPNQHYYTIRVQDNSSEPNKGICSLQLLKLPLKRAEGALPQFLPFGRRALAYKAVWIGKPASISNGDRGRTKLASPPCQSHFVCQPRHTQPNKRAGRDRTKSSSLTHSVPVMLTVQDIPCLVLGNSSN